MKRSSRSRLERSSVINDLMN